MTTERTGNSGHQPFPLAMQVHGEMGMRDVPRLRTQGLAIEIADFFPVGMWQGDWRETAQEWATALRSFPFGKCLHGAFVDLHPGADEPELVAFAHTRHRQSLEVAETIGFDLMVVHSDFPMHAIPPIKERDLAARLVEYFGALAADAAPRGVTLVIENIFDHHPHALVNIVREINAPNVGLSLDVGHAHLFSSIALDQWVYGMQPYLRHCHLHDNDGIHDRHWKLGEGTMTYRAFFDAVAAVPTPPRVTVEVVDRGDAWDCVNTLIARGWYALPTHPVVATEELGVHSGID